MSELLWRKNHEGDNTAFPEFFYDNVNLIVTLKPVQQLGNHKIYVNTTAINPYGDKLLTGYEIGCLSLWDIGSHMSKPQTIIKTDCSSILTTNFLSSNKIIAAGDNSSINVIELHQTGVKNTIYSNHHSGKVISSIVIDSNTFVTCSNDMSVRLFDVRQQYPSTTINEANLINESEIESFTKSSEEQKFNIVPSNIETHNESLLFDYKDQNIQPLSLDVHPIDKKRFTVSRDDGTVILYDLRKIQNSENFGFSVREAYNKRMSVSHVAFDEYGERLAASVLGGSVHIFETSDSYKIEKFESSADESTESRGKIRISDYVNDSGDIDLTALREAVKNRKPESEDEEIKNLTKNAPGCIKVLNSHISFDAPSPVRWFGNFVAVGSDDALVYMYDGNDGTVKKVLTGHHGHVESIVAHRERRILVTCGLDDFAQVWQPMACTDIDRAAVEMEVREALHRNRKDDGYLRMSECNVM